MPLVPSSASAVENSERFDLFRTTGTGLRFYVQPLASDVAKAIKVGSRDFQFLCGQAGDQCLLVLIRDGNILRQEPKSDGDLDSSDVLEVLEFLSQWELRARRQRNEQ